MPQQYTELNIFISFFLLFSSGFSQMKINFAYQAKENSENKEAN